MARPGSTRCVPQGCRYDSMAGSSVRSTACRPRVAATAPMQGSAYWRYWHAPPGGTWTYSQVGAGGYRLPTRCAVEGWVWSDAATADTPPRLAAPRPTCDAPPPTAPPVTARPPAPAPPAAVGGGTPQPPPIPGAPVSGAPPGRQGPHPHLEPAAAPPHRTALSDQAARPDRAARPLPPWRVHPPWPLVDPRARSRVTTTIRTTRIRIARTAPANRSRVGRTPMTSSPRPRSPTTGRHRRRGVRWSGSCSSRCSQVLLCCGPAPVRALRASRDPSRRHRSRCAVRTRSWRSPGGDGRSRPGFGGGDT